MRIEPPIVEPGTQASLSVDRSGLPPDAVGGAGAEWQCWTGDAWRATHQLVRGLDGVARTIEVQPGATTSIPAVGLALPNSYPIVVPDVEPGTYRIHDVVFVDGGTVEGFLIVQVS